MMKGKDAYNYFDIPYSTFDIRPNYNLLCQFK
jgi:hypothetical protein